jgi:hypothetical protein
MERFTLRTETDTATAHPGIPIFFIHSIEAPFCNLPGCWCKTDKANLAPFLAAIHNGALTVQEAASFFKGKGTPMTPKNVSVGSGTIVATKRDFIEGYQAGHLTYMAERQSIPCTDEQLTRLFLKKLESMETSTPYGMGFIVGWLATLSSKGLKSVSVPVSPDDQFMEGA